MNIIENPPPAAWTDLCRRPALDFMALRGTVKGIFDQVRQGGDAALRALTKKIDNVDIDALQVSPEEIAEAWTKTPSALQEAIKQASQNIEKFHAAQHRPIEKIETMSGVVCWRKASPIDSVGLYAPGGTAPLFSTVLMLGIPARLSGCRQVTLCSPPDAQGRLHPAILMAADLVGIKKIFKIGGSQAIAGMTFGTESVPAVYKIFGPGNQYVTMAKRMATEHGVNIDIPAGPSEVLVLADETANPEFAAADLLSQAEHGKDSQVILVASTLEIIMNIQRAAETQLAALPRAEIAREALQHSHALTLPDPKAQTDFINAYAPEHLILNVQSAEQRLEDIRNAGSVFLGNYTPEAAGDYASGTNHTLPTAGTARAYGGVSLESFLKYVTVQEISPEGLRNIAPVIISMAEAEQLQAHAAAVQVRLNALTSLK